MSSDQLLYTDFDPAHPFKFNIVRFHWVTHSLEGLDDTLIGDSPLIAQEILNISSNIDRTRLSNERAPSALRTRPIRGSYLTCSLCGYTKSKVFDFVRSFSSLLTPATSLFFDPDPPIVCYQEMTWVRYYTTYYSTSLVCTYDQCDSGRRGRKPNS